MSWTCPDCGAGGVHSRTEFVRVYDWRAILEGREYDLADALRRYKRAPDADEGAKAFVRRWAREDEGEPEYLCIECVTPHTSREVPE